MALKSWDCKGCVNIEYRILPDGIFAYCLPMVENRHRKEWQGDKIECLDKITEEEWRNYNA